MTLIIDYATLRTVFEQKMHRTDLTDRFDGYVQLAENWIRPKLESDHQEKTISLAAVDGIADLPADAESLLSLTHPGGLPLVSMSPDALKNSFAANHTGQVTAYTIEGRKIRLAPANTAMLDLVYRAILPSLQDADGQRTNWLLDTDADLYLFACLAQACREVKDAPGEAKYLALAEAKIGVVNHRARQRQSANRLRSRPFRVI